MTPVTSCKGFSADASVCSESSRAWENGHKIGANDAPQLLHLLVSDPIANHRESISGEILTTLDTGQRAAIAEIGALSVE